MRAEQVAVCLILVLPPIFLGFRLLFLHRQAIVDIIASQSRHNIDSRVDLEWALSDMVYSCMTSNDSAASASYPNIRVQQDVTRLAAVGCT